MIIGQRTTIILGIRQLIMEQKFIQNKFFCARLFRSLTIYQNGDVSQCCVAGICDSRINLRNSTIEEIWNSTEFRKKRLQVLNDEPLEMCKGCYNLEKSNLPSFRIHSNKAFKITKDELVSIKNNNGKISIVDLIDLSLRLSNICDYKCRICGPQNSTSWIKESLILNPGENVEPIILNKLVPDFITMFKDLIPQIKSIYFAGGEPLISNEHYDILKLLLPYSQQIALDYNTNLTTLRFNSIDIVNEWKKFKQVKIGISLDGAGAQVELMRKGINYKKILERHNVLSSQTEGIFPYIYLTISVLNLFHLPDALDDWIKNKLVIWPDQLVLNCISEPRHLHPNILNNKERLRLNTKYEAYLLSKKESTHMVIYIMIERTLHYALSTLNEPTWRHERKKFSSWTKKIDQFRNEKTELIFPELASLLSCEDEK